MKRSDVILAEVVNITNQYVNLSDTVAKIFFILVSMS